MGPAARCWRNQGASMPAGPYDHEMLGLITSIRRVVETA